ncbi:Protein TASOR, partial [Nibea albiflora]
NQKWHISAFKLNFFSVFSPHQYNDFRAKRREAGYSEEDLKESYGFLLFDDANKANTLGETGVLTGNSTCTTLGDPSNGVYISMYSDCLDLNRWYHGKSGYIAIIRLTKGRVKKVSENYTQNFTVPTEGFDCHVSEQLPSVSAKTSSFLAFERTQYYMYELLNDGSSKTAQSPSAACPFAIVSFSYTDTKAALEAPQEKSDEKKSDTKSGQRKPAISSDILRVLPVLNYAEGEVEKTVIDPSEELCEVFMQHMHNYATLINPGLALSPSRDFSIFPDQYDVPDAHKHLYSSPEWTNRAWQTMRSYLNKPVSFQLPVPKVTEILAAGQEERMEDLDDDVYICLSSPEEAPANHV